MTAALVVEDSIIYRVKDIMRIMGVGRDSAYSIMRANGFPATKLGRTYIVTKKNFEAWLDQYAGRKFQL